MYQLSQLAFSLWRLETCQKSHQMGIFSQQQDKDAMKEKHLVEVREGIVFWQKLTLWSLKSTWFNIIPLFTKQKWSKPLFSWYIPLLLLLPQITTNPWLRTIQIYHRTVLEVRTSKSISLAKIKMVEGLCSFWKM